MDTWNEKYNISKAYYEEYGNLLVPDKYIYKNINLGNWIYWQRKNYKDNNLSQNKIELLNKIGMVWDVNDERWNDFFDIACRFKSDYNTLVIPINYKYMNHNLGKWISHQRQRYKKGIMPEIQVKKLESIDMVWDASNNNISTSFPEQAIFYYIQKCYKDAINRYNDLGFELDIFIPSIKTAIEYDGFIWHTNNKNDIVKNNKCQKNKINLIRIREEGLEEIETNNYVKVLYIKRGYTNLKDVIIEILRILNVKSNIKIDLQNHSSEIIKNYINVYNNQWNRMFNEAKKYYEEKCSLINIDDKKVDGWVRHQRQRYFGKKNPLTNDQIKKLESIGMVWDVYNLQWENSYKIAKEYYEENGNLNIKNNCIFNNFNIGNWISSQRNMYKNKTLSNYRFENLKKIGMVWDASIDVDMLWEKHYQIAKHYYEENDNLLISTHAKYMNDNLGAWINKQRNDKDKLSKEKIDKLNSIGMVWDVYQNKWYSNYELLKDYFKKNGNILVPFDFKINGVNLGMWLKRQMGNRQKLNNSQIELLEKLNITWKRNPSKWDNMFNLAKEYYEEKGNLLINTHSKYKGENLGAWINKQRDDYQNQNNCNANINFDSERIKKLDSIGMIWDVSDYLWLNNYKILKEYYEETGNINISTSLEYKGIKIGKWLQNQKSSYRGYKGRKKLSAEKIEMLNELEIKW